MAKKKDWIAMYNNATHPDVANTLTEAKQQSKKYYRNECGVHGKTVYTTLDNACPLCVRENSRRRSKEDKDFNRPRELVGQRKHRALQKGILFEIDTAFVRESIPKICPVLGFPLSYEGEVDTSPSIDRLVPEHGYTEDNVRIISTRANKIKSNGTADEHLKIALWMMKELGLDEKEIQQKIKDMS